MATQKLLRGHDASASLRHPQMAPGKDTGSGRESTLAPACRASGRAGAGVTKSNDPLIFDPRVVLFRNILTPGHSVSK